jgi:aspartyl-tRNA(Asn)/glutamyl-tRNA(Gln) amidotransferase subunit A
MAGCDPQEETSADVPVQDYLRDIDSGLKGIRIGVGNYALDDATSDVVRAFEDAVRQLERLGASTKQVDTSVFGSYFGAGGAVLLSEAAAYHRKRIAERPQDFGDDVLMRLQTGAEMKAIDYIRATQLMHEVRRTCDKTFLADVDLLVMPTTMMPAPRIDSVASEDPTLGLSRITLPTDFTGQPAMSAPCGFTDRGLPIGLMIVGRWFDEATVLRAAHAFEGASGASTRRPPVDA